MTGILPSKTTSVGKAAMSVLKIFGESGTEVRTVREHDAIASTLHGVGVRFEKWEAAKKLSADATDEDILDAYRTSIDRLKAESGFQSEDVIAVAPNNPKKEELRKKFLDEHVHADYEVRFFVGGSGLFYLHINGRVYGVLCEQGDLISVPANVKHWFDMGEEPDLKCIRLFTNPEGWVAKFTGDRIAKEFPTFEEF